MNIRELIQYGCDEAGVPELAGNISVEWSNRMTKRAGDANYWEGIKMGRVRFSSKLWPTMEEQVQEDLVLHEVAHVIDIYVNGRALVNAQKKGGHGITWQRIAQKIGAKPQRYMKSSDANFAMYRRRVTRYTYVCKGCGHQHMLTQNLLTRMRKGKTYICKTCRTRIEV